jgi:hypothetical protein
MSLPALLADLLEHGRARVPRPTPAISPREIAESERTLREHEAVRRLDFPGVPPDLFLPAAVWAATAYYRACQLAVYRDLDAGAIDELLAASCPAGEPAARHWSVDLVFCFLPDLVRHAAAASQQDPLVTRLRGWAADWPLSSVGMAGISARHEDEITGHPGLLQLYVDRIIAKKDWSRLGHPAVREAIRGSIGAHTDHWPALASKLADDQQSPRTHDAPAC